MHNQPQGHQLAELLQQSLQNNRQAMLTVTSNSMAPLIRRGDEVLIVAIERPSAGDIITFTTKSGLLTHRFWGFLQKEEGDFLLTRGDKPLLFDSPTPATNILGLVVKRQRHGRWLHLKQGRGRWLNQHLARLAAFDNRIILGGVISPVQIQVRAGKHPAWWRQGIHWALYTWARVVTAVVSHTSGSNFSPML